MVVCPRCQRGLTRGLAYAQSHRIQCVSCRTCEATVYPVMGETLCTNCAERMNVCEACQRLFIGKWYKWPADVLRSWWNWSQIRRKSELIL